MSSPPKDPSHDDWARFRFAIIGPLLASPPATGQLQASLNELAARTWKHPLQGTPMRVGRSTLERWFYRARGARDPIAALRPKVRTDAGTSRVLSDAIKAMIRAQHGQHPSWTYQLQFDNLAVLIRQDVDLGPSPSYPTVRRFMKAQGLTVAVAIPIPTAAAARNNALRSARCAVMRSSMSTPCGIWTSTMVHVRS